MQVHHTGMISHSIEKDLVIYEQLGYVQVDDVITDEVQHNRLVFMMDLFDQRIELIQPLDDQSTVKNAKVGIHHLCYEVESLEAAVAMVREKKMGAVFTKPIVAPAFEGRRIVFAYLKTGLIVEFLEREGIRFEDWE